MMGVPSIIGSKGACLLVIPSRLWRRRRLAALTANVPGATTSREGHPMTIRPDHTIVPARDKDVAATFFASLFGLSVKPFGPFAAVSVNDSFTLDFADQTHFEPHHLAFHVTEPEFDAIFGRVQQAGIPYSADPHHQQVGQLNHRLGGRGFYFYDPNGHNFEVLTRRAA
jgi:catechol 2,3-dioxygenase-like lactoylglutathione lyase family enzyme